MCSTSARSEALPLGWRLYFPAIAWPAVVWLVLTALLTALLIAGLMPNGDADDLLKLQEIRHLIATGDPFDRVLPGVLQPEPLVSHWPWLVDAPYAAIAAMLAPLLGQDAGLRIAAATVPPALLLLALAVLYRVIESLQFRNPGIMLALSAFVGLTAFAEFQPWRVDYHNIQMLLLLASMLLAMRADVRSAAWNGAVIALSISISAEIAPFLILPMAIYAVEFVGGGKAAAARLNASGAAMLAASLGLHGLISGPNVLSAACDRYALPQMLAVAGAGLVFTIAPLLVGSRGPVLRVTVLAAGAAVTAGLLATWFPQCLAGPYGGLSDYVRETWLGRIEQERSIFASPEFFSSGRFARVALGFVGAAATVAVAIAHRGRDRAWLVLAMYSLAGLILSLAYLRYVRFLPLLAGPGIAVLINGLLPRSVRWRDLLAEPIAPALPGRILAAPGVAILAALLAQFAFGQRPPAELQGVDLASACDEARMDRRTWPQGSRVMAAPSVGVSLLAPDGPNVVAVPVHTSAPGIERSQRFFDPATQAPQALLAATGATHVAVCRIDGQLPASLAARLPLAAALAGARPPAWLETCADDGRWGLLVYRVKGAGEAASQCPVPNAEAG